jgi:hypothetical protein
MVHSMEIVVVFPAPLGPSKPKISPDSTVMSNLSTAVSELNAFVNWLVSIMLVIEFSSLSTVGYMRHGFIFICGLSPKTLGSPRRELAKAKNTSFCMLIVDVDYEAATEEWQ